MSVLYPVVPFDPAETPLSFATRLASFHLRSSVVPFLHDLRIKPDTMIGCDEGAVERLANIAGVDAGVLHHNAAHRIAKRRFNLRGHELSSEFFSTPDTVFCPACLREDDQGAADVGSVRRGRLEWTLRPVSTCPRHGLALVRRKRQRWDDMFHELARRVPERGGDLDRLIEATEQRAPSPLQDYVLARVDGEANDGWLDSQDLEQAVLVTEKLGRLVAFGPSKKASELDEAEREEAGRVGFEITSQGETAIRDALSQVQSDFRRKGGKTGGRRNAFGSFYEWLASNKDQKDPGDIKRILREHIFDTMEVASGEAVLGKILTERRLHNVESLAAETKLDPRTLAGVLAARGLVPAEGKVCAFDVFDAEAGRKVAASMQRLTHVSALGKVLNCTRPQASQLLDEGLIVQISGGAGTVAGRTRKAVDHREIERFLAALHHDARPVADVPAGLVPISKAAEKAKCPSVDIVHLILAGFLENVARHGAEVGYAAILVDPDEVRNQMAAVMIGLSATDAFRRLRISRNTGWSLVLGNDEPRLRPTIIEGRNGRHEIYRFEEEAIAAFATEFTTAARLATEHNLQVGIVISQLKRCGIRPAMPRRYFGLDFYRTSQIPEIRAA